MTLHTHRAQKRRPCPAKVLTNSTETIPITRQSQKTQSRHLAAKKSKTSNRGARQPPFYNAGNLPAFSSDVLCADEGKSKENKASLLRTK